MKNFYLIFLFLLSLNGFSQEEKTKVFYAKAYQDKERKILLYQEKHEAFYEKGRIVDSKNTYYNSTGKEIIATLNSDYRKNLLLPTYTFEDLRTESREGLKHTNLGYVIFRQEKGKSEETSSLGIAKNLFSCQGWHYYLVENLEKIEKEALEMNLIFPSKLSYYSFRAKTMKQDEKNLVIRLEFSNWFIRIFAPYLEITYDKKKREIVGFYGASNILDNNGIIQNVYIDYSKEAPSDKSKSSPALKKSSNSK